MARDDGAVARDLLRRWDTANKRDRDHLRSTGIPVPEMQRAALSDEDPWVRRRCLAFLDHHAADESTAIFLAALDDPVAPVREIALHGLACERCRTDDVCVADVVPRVIQTLERDTDAEVRYKTLAILRDFALRHPAALDAVRNAADNDDDPLLREGARLALGFGLLPSRNDLRRRLGRHGRAMTRKPR